MSDRLYRGRLAPSPTGYLHLGHAQTFWIAQQRARAQAGVLILRVEDLDRERCKPEFAEALIEDLRWFGLDWVEGPDLGGPSAPYRQQDRLPIYRQTLRQLAAKGAVYPCRCTRRDVDQSIAAPHADDNSATRADPCRPLVPTVWTGELPSRVNWRFRVSFVEQVHFLDGCAGPQRFCAGGDFGDFVVWRKDDLPAYQLTVVVDDAAMRVSEVVRGADLLLSTAQQLLLYRALGLEPPSFYHCPLVTNPDGTRLAKRTGAHSLQALRAAGVDPASLHLPRDGESGAWKAVASM